MIIEKSVFEMLEERISNIKNDLILYENDDGVVEILSQEDYPIDPDTLERILHDVEAELYNSDVNTVEQQDVAAEVQPNAAAQPDTTQPDVEQPEITKDDLIAMQISTTQDIFTKMYLIKRIEKLENYVNNLIDLLEVKYDIDEFDQLKRMKIYIDTLNKIALTLPTDTLYHIVVGFEFDLMDLLDRLAEAIRKLEGSKDEQLDNY